MTEHIFSKYNRVEIIRSKYYYADCDVLKNKLGVKDEAKLTALEEDLTNQRLAELVQNPLKGRFGIAHLKKTHKYIFQDIYPFAGKLREEDIWKGDTFFLKCQFIQSRLEEVLDKLKVHNYLIKLDVAEFSKHAAYYMAELNMIHPFREGNGRAIREFIRCLALRAGYIINWALTNSKELLNASILSVDKIYEPLANCTYGAIENK